MFYKKAVVADDKYTAAQGAFLNETSRRFHFQQPAAYEIPSGWLNNILDYLLYV